MSQYREMLLYLYVNLRLMNKLTTEMGNFFTDTMRDFNSHEFEEMVDPITCTPNEEPEEKIVRLFRRKNLVSSHGQIFQYRIVVLLQLLAPNDTRLIPRWLSLTLPRVSPQRGLVLRRTTHTTRV